MRARAALLLATALALGGCECSDQTRLLVKLRGRDTRPFDELAVEVTSGANVWVGARIVVGTGSVAEVPTDFRIYVDQPVEGPVTVCITAFSEMMPVNYGCGDGEVVLRGTRRVVVELHRIACGDGRIQPTEDCEPSDLGGATCASLGYVSGTVACNPATCLFELDGCAACGNGVLDGARGEECDGDDFDTQTCFGLAAAGWPGLAGVIGGPLACNADCTLDVSGCTSCGNETIDPGEQCDGSALGGAGCSLGGDAGGPVCLGDCTVTLLHCSMCTATEDTFQPELGTVDPGEACDGGDFRGRTCADFDFAGGFLRCDDACGIDTTGCNDCGDWIVDPGEECDGPDFIPPGLWCGALTPPFPTFYTGFAPCRPDCTRDLSACTNCGNATINAGEQCDGTAAGGATCASLGLGTGALGCAGTCTRDVAGCTFCGNGVCDAAELAYGCFEDCYDPAACGDGTCDAWETCRTCAADCGAAGAPSGLPCCGNGVIDPIEECEGTDLGGATCASLGLLEVTGPLLCGADCAFDRSGCGLCGNGSIDEGEDCDGADLGAAAASWTCPALAGLPDGEPVGCIFCSLESGQAIRTCHSCGDGFRDEDEACDGIDLDGRTCLSLGYVSGVLGCAADCTLDCTSCDAGAGTCE